MGGAILDLPITCISVILSFCNCICAFVTLSDENFSYIFLRSRVAYTVHTYLRGK